MTITLTEEQVSHLPEPSAEPARVVDPRSRITYVLVPESDYESIREIIEDEREQRAIREAALRDVAQRILEDE